VARPGRVDSDGDKIGSIEEIYLDQDTDKPEWLAVKTGLFGGKISFVPIEQASQSGDAVRVPFTKSQVKGSPNADADGELSQEEESALYEHYGRDYGESRSDSGLPEGGTGTADHDRDSGDVARDTSGPETDSAMTRSEEELSVGTRKRETGRVRLKKHIVTENVTKTVPVQREEVRLERDEITDANRDAAMSGKDLSEEEAEMTLSEDEVVVDKKTVPKERVRMDKDVVSEDREVSEDVRSERIEMEGDGTTVDRDQDRR